MLKTFSLTFLVFFLAAAPANAAASATDERRQAPTVTPAASGVQVAQAYDFDVYIDQYGREVIVDPRSGRVVEIRAPAIERPPRDPWHDVRPRRERDWRSYDFTDPRDVERFHRDREAIIRDGIESRGRRGYEEPYDDWRRDGWRDGAPGEWDEARPQPPYERDYGAYPQPLPENRSVRRAPLEPPPAGSGSLHPVPPPEFAPGQDGDRQEARQPRQPDVGISVPSVRGASREVAAFQVLLDRVGASPGVIDGRTGDNVNKAIEAYEEITGQRLRTYDRDWIEAELEKTGGPAFTEYTITDEDAAGPFIASLPEDYGEKARLERLGYTRVSEMLAERFHMDEKYLLALNPDANFDRPGTVITVANIAKPLEYEVARLVADKGRKQLRVYDHRGRLVAAYPATIGSVNTPSPTGTHEVTRIAFNPEYTYNPKINFKQGDNDRVLTIPPGPNGPVGSIWIALSKPTYGIHGTPDPEKIGKTYSNGCVRLTNWDAEELAKRVKPGVTVEFVE